MSDSPLTEDILRAGEALDWIEQQRGAPLPEDGYARIETTVGAIRAEVARLSAAGGQGE